MTHELNTEAGRLRAELGRSLRGRANGRASVEERRRAIEFARRARSRGERWHAISTALGIATKKRHTPQRQDSLWLSPLQRGRAAAGGPHVAVAHSAPLPSCTDAAIAPTSGSNADAPRARIVKRTSPSMRCDRSRTEPAPVSWTPTLCRRDAGEVKQLVVARAAVGDRRVSSSQVVEAFDVLEDHPPRFAS